MLKGDGKRNNVTSPFPILTLTHRALAKVASLGARLKSKIQDSDALEICLTLSVLDPHSCR